MLNLPIWMITIVREFVPAIYEMSTWYKVEVLIARAILAAGKRTVSAVLRMMGLSTERNYAIYHRVLSRAVWSGLEVSAILLREMVKTFDTREALVFGVDETIERRRGEKLRAKGIYRDGVRSSKSHFVNASGLRWVSMMGLFSLVTLLANALLNRHDLPVRTATWYTKTLPTSSDALALVRSHLWAYFTFQMSADQPDMLKVPRALLERFYDLLCYAT